MKKTDFINNFLALKILLLFSVFSSYSQVRVPLTPRTSSATPGTSIYQIKGDFTMIGNTNLTLENYGINKGNTDGDMEYVDIDNTAIPGNDTFNSSSAYLDLSTENGAIAECSKIVFAGLYWTGKADGEEADDNADGDNDSNTFLVTKNGMTKKFDKRKVSIKGPNASTYTELTANASDIYFPDGIDDNMYSAFSEVTDYVIQNGIGDYYVADIATIEGIPIDGTGYYGGWGMVVIYENSKMKWRSVTVFDGHAFVASELSEYVVNASGFYAVPSGSVNFKIGLIAGEGDVDKADDFFQIERRNSATYQPLSHVDNRARNFFNSTILTDGNAKNPDLANNTGVDIVMFNIDNTSNAIIDNNQTSTSFRYGTTGDAFVIMNVTFSVDTYVPEIGGNLSNTALNGSLPDASNNALNINKDADYTIQIKNTGTEAINNSIITVPLPEYLNADNLNINYNIYAPLNATTNPNRPFHNKNIGANGAVVWNLGTLPIPADPNMVLADLSFTLTLTSDCNMINDLGPNPSVSLNGQISGIGNISNISFITDLIQAYETNGTCIGEPIYGANLIPINTLSKPPTASNPPNIFVERCVDTIPTPDSNVVTDAADSQGAVIIAFVSDVADGMTCPETIERTYSVTNTCDDVIYVIQTIVINDTTPPTFDETPPANITVECDAITEAKILTASDTCGATTLLVTESIINGSCNNDYTIIRTWTATDACGNSNTHIQNTIVQDTTALEPTTSFDTVLNVSCSDIPDTPELQFTDNCSDPSVSVAFDETNSFVENVAASEYQIIRSWTVSDSCNNEAIYTQTLAVSLDEIITSVIARDICYIDGTTDLNQYIESENMGVWKMLEGDTTATLSDTGVFDPTGFELSETFLPNIDRKFYFFSHTITVNGCINITEIAMHVNADCVDLPCGINDVEISKVITPNGDMYSEFFTINGLELCDFTYDVKIFNRWGALIFKSDNYQNDWSGTINSKSVGKASKIPNGTYYYIITLKNSNMKPFTGPIYLGTN